MKKTKLLLIIVLFLLLMIPVAGQKNTNDEKVKSVIVTEEKYDMLVKKQLKESETFYDIHGNITESITYKQGKVDKHFKYQYDQDNNKIKEEEFDTAGKLKEYSEYKYENGLRTEKTVFDSAKKIKSKKTYTYTKF